MWGDLRPSLNTYCEVARVAIVPHQTVAPWGQHLPACPVLATCLRFTETIHLINVCVLPVHRVDGAARLPGDKRPSVGASLCNPPCHS